MQNERARKLAGKIKTDMGFSDELARKVGRMSREDREIVIAAVVESGVCDRPIVRAIRSDFGAFGGIREEGLLRLDDFEREYAAMKRE
jgi:hypothetical protein